MGTKKKRVICNKCSKKTVIDKMLFFENKYYHSNCLGTEFKKCPITGEFMPKWKEKLYNELRIEMPYTFNLYIEEKRKRHLMRLEPK